jgi:hypothetical protein
MQLTSGYCSTDWWARLRWRWWTLPPAMGISFGTCSWPYSCHSSELPGGDGHLDLVTTAQFAWPGAIALFCVPEDEYRAGRHLHGPGDPLEDLGWGTKSHRQRGLRRWVPAGVRAEQKIHLNRQWYCWKLTLSYVFSYVNCFCSISPVRIGLRHTSYKKQVFKFYSTICTRDALDIRPDNTAFF